MEKLERWLAEQGERQVFFAALFLCAAAVLLFYQFVHRPMTEAYDDALREQSELRQTETDVMNFKNAHLDGETYQQELSGQEERIKAALPDTLEQGAFLALLQEKAFASHVKLVGVTPGREAEGDGYRSLPVTVGFSGSYFEVLDFLEAIEESDRFIKIESFQLSQEKDGLKGKMQLTIYAALDKEP